MSEQKDVKVHRSPTGLGLKATRTFDVDEEIIEYTGRRITDDDLENRSNRYLFRLNDRYMIDGADRSNLARYINHSCSPNAQAVLSHDEKQITIEAIRRIKAGDEITIDYGEEYFEEFIAPVGCRCIKCEPSRER